MFACTVHTESHTDASAWAWVAFLLMSCLDAVHDMRAEIGASRATVSQSSRHVWVQSPSETDLYLGTCETHVNRNVT